jgi:hypothetical protein
MKRACVSVLAGLAAATAVLVGTNPVLSANAAPASEGASAAASAPKIIGMSAPSNLWSQRIKEVGGCGVEARRIFASLQSDGKSQSTLIAQTKAAGMMPVISYKVANVNTLINGGYDSWLKATRTYLDGLDIPVTVSFWHEPHGDMAPADFRAGSQKFLDLMKSSTTPEIKVGPILNGWLLDNRVADFASYTSTSLLTQWDFVAVDSYQSGTVTNPGSKLPARAVPLLATWLDKQGFPNKPIGLGEYNGFTAAAIKAAGEAILSTPEAWFGLAWNSTGDRYAPLTGDRITAFQATKADPRALHDAAC